MKYFERPEGPEFESLEEFRSSGGWDCPGIVEHDRRMQIWRKRVYARVAVVMIAWHAAFVALGIMIDRLFWK